MGNILVNFLLIPNPLKIKGNWGFQDILKDQNSRISFLCRSYKVTLYRVSYGRHIEYLAHSRRELSRDTPCADQIILPKIQLGKIVVCICNSSNAKLWKNILVDIFFEKPYHI